MAPNRFRRDQREKREVTPFSDEKVVPQIPPEWRDLEAPMNFTWVVQDELAGMGWPKSRDQLRFLISQGIDHLVTLSSDKLPPHYAFPELKWTLIPVEDFTGPTISEIKKFIGIIDEARRNGEGVGVHCAEGRGRTGVMCACYLIYYHDIAPWDAIRIMRRQRPGSVERKVQEETVVKFYNLLNDYGKYSLDDLETREKQLKEMMQKRQLQALQYDSNIMLMQHTSKFFGNCQTSDQKAKRLEKFERMRRARSMPKMDAEEEQTEDAGAFHNHVQNFFNGDQRSRSQPRPEKQEKQPRMEEDERARGVTPGRSLMGELSNLKPVKPRKSTVDIDTESKSCDFTKHFKDFMTTPTSVKILKRNRSFSRTRDKEDSNKEDENSTRSSEEEEKGVCDSTESEKELSRGEHHKSHKKSHEESIPISRSESPEASISRSESGKDSGSEANSFSSQRNLDSDCRRRFLSTSHQPDPEVTPDLELVYPNKKSSTDSTHSIATLRYSRKTSSTDFTTLGETYVFMSAIDNTRRHSAPGGDPEEENQQQNQPPPPAYKPSFTVDTSSTYSYYTRIRSRADEARRREIGEKGSAGEATNPPPRPPSPQIVNNRSFNSRRARAATIERDMQVTVTLTESQVDDSTSTSASTTSWRSRIYGDKPKENLSYYPVRRRRQQSPETPKTVTPSSTSGPLEPQTSSTRASRSHYRRANSGPLPEMNNNTEEEPLRECCRKGSADGAASSSNGHGGDPPLGRTKNTNDDNDERKVSNGLRRERAKSEGLALYDDDDLTPRSATGTSGLKENYFLAAARKWASYDKPVSSYSSTTAAATASTLSRDGWKRNYRKFNYSKFLNYTRETYV